MGSWEPAESPAAESRRSRWANPPSQSRYRRGIERSRPIWARSSATWAGVAVFPSTAEAASPGRTSVPAKTSIDTTSSVATAAAERRTRKRAIGRLRRAGPDGTIVRASAVLMRALPLRPEPDVAVVPSAEVEERAGLDPLHLGRRGVHDVLVRPADVAATLVLHLLHLEPERRGRIDGAGAGRLLHHRVEGLVLEMCLVPHRA